MTKLEFYIIMQRMTKERPKYDQDLELMGMLGYLDDCGMLNAAYLEPLFDRRPDLAASFSRHRNEVEGRGLEARKSGGRVFPVHAPFSSELRRRLLETQDSEYYGHWAKTMRALPEYTLPLPEISQQFYKSAKEIWQENVCGQEEIFLAVMDAAVEYVRTGHTTALLLAGPPGIGKSLVAECYGKILGLPCSFLSGPSESSGRGLSGAPNIYIGAGAGAVVQAMIDHKTGNPVIVIDELEKSTPMTGNQAGLQQELLSLLDDRSSHWRDNFLEIELDASHIPLVATANDTDQISPPLLNRMDVIRMEAPGLDLVHSILQHYVKKEISHYEEAVLFPEDTVHSLVDGLWKQGHRSCRPYQRAVKRLLSRAYQQYLEGGETVTVTPEQTGKILPMFQGERFSQHIGF